MQTMFCDKHPQQKMVRIQLSSRDSELKQNADGFKCTQCSRVYILAGDLGYLDYVDGRLINNSAPQLCCPEHKSPLYIAAFQFNGDESIRTWKCDHSGCHKIMTTVGENYFSQS
jgi:hypothetical protein